MRTMLIAIAAGILAVTMFLFLSGGTVLAIQHDPSGKTYEVTVKPSFGGEFQDCFRFGVDGSFTVDLLGAGDWVTYWDNGTTLAWNGIASGGVTVDFRGHTTDFYPGEIKARGKSNVGDTFLVKGFENAACVAFGAQGANGSWN